MISPMYKKNRGANKLKILLIIFNISIKHNKKYY